MVQDMYAKRACGISLEGREKTHFVYQILPQTESMWPHIWTGP